jgi:two-component system nitrogen regulation sensor histidine kinase NtrY
VLKRVANEAHIVIDDEGAGVPFELRERVFDLFYTTRPRGTGLGLSIVSQLAVAMGGGVRFGETEAGGARVTLRWPLEDAEE